jgi:hypothetical protein
MKKKLAVWILTVSLTATNGCIVCAQDSIPDIPPEAQENIINEEDTQTNPLEKDIIESTAEDGAKTQEDKDKNEPDEELIPPEEANMEEIILKNPEDGLLINQPSPSQDYELASKTPNTKRSKSLTGNSVPLDETTIRYSNICRQIPCENLGGIYFLNDRVLSFYATDTQQSSVIHTFDRLTDVYAANDRLYVLQRNYTGSSVIIVYNLLARSVENTFEFEHAVSVIGADPSGRIYLAGYRDNRYSIYLLSSSGSLLSQTDTSQEIYSFAGFDSKNGNFYFEGYANWVYWGFDHDMNALRAGNVSGNTISCDESVLIYVCQSYWFERQDQVGMLGDQYLCVDSTFHSGLSIWDSNKYSPSAPSDTEILFLARNNKEDGDFDSRASVGTRTVYRKATNSIIAFKDNSTIAEYDLSTGNELFLAKTDYPVFSLMEYKGGVAAIEKSGDDFYYEYFPWTYASHIEISGEKSKIDIGETLTLTAIANGSVDEKFIWSSGNPKVASTTQSGKVFGWSKGQTTITVKNSKGLTAEYNITVSGNPPAKDPVKNIVATAGTASHNMSANNYNVRSTVTNSYLVPNANGSFTRVECCGEQVVAETYSDNGSLTDKKTINKELGLFGGFYSGKDYHYFVFGQNNPTEDDAAEVMRIVKYSKDFKRIASVSVKGANTYIPFSAGSLRMAESNGKLYIHTCHEMYASTDGLHHQANMTYVINEENMNVEQSYYDVLNIAQSGYVSHSFNQFVQTDGIHVYRVDHGDAYPRAISITQCENGGDITKVNYTLPVTLGNAIGHNDTGASIGGFELSSENCIIAGNAVDFTAENINVFGKRNIFISVTDKNLSGSNVVWLTQYDENQDFDVRTPHLIKIGEDQFLVMWEEASGNGTEVHTKMATIDGSGNMTSGIVQRDMRLSDCKPEKCGDGLVRWFTSRNNPPVIYAVNPFGLNVRTKGDINNDGAVNLRDLMMCLNHVAKKSILKDDAFLAADVDGNGAVTLIDLMKILNYVSKKSTEI